MGGSGFSLQWPTDGGHITAAFTAATGYVTIAAATGAAVKSGSDGKVIAAVEDTVQVATGFYTIIYSNLQNLKVETNQDITAGTLIGESASSDGIRVMVLQAIDPTPLFPSQPSQPATITPATTTSSTTSTTKPADSSAPASTTSGKLYVSPTVKNVRIRSSASAANTDNVLGQVDTTDILEVIETAADARKKLGVKDQWIHIRTLWGLEGYSAGEFFKEYTGTIPTVTPGATPYGAANVTGLNLDMYNPLGHPGPDRIKGVGWIRVKFNVSYNPDNGTYGNTDVNATFNRMKPFLKPYTDAGVKVLMVFTHQLYGEGAGYQWEQMDSGRWNQLIPKYADFAKQTAQLFLNTGLVHAYQIWNEQDTEAGKGRAAVPIPPADYGNMLTQTIRAIRSVDSKTPIITGGHVRGAGIGTDYANATLKAMPADVRPDGIAAHPYGLGPKGNSFSNNGSLEDAIRKFGAVMPDKPIWFTEWGVLDFQGNMSVVEGVTNYASGFVKIIKNQYPGKVAAAIWYAWADGMDNGYGLVDKDDKDKKPLRNAFLGL